MKIISVVLVFLFSLNCYSQEYASFETTPLTKVKAIKSEIKMNNSYSKNSSDKLRVIEIEPLCSSKTYNECLGIVLQKKEETIYFATNGKYIYKFSLLNITKPELISTVHEVSDTWNDDYGDTFLHEMKLGDDGFIYAVAENCILKIDTKDGNYTILIEDIFSGPWGIDLDSEGNIFVGDHHGGIHVYIKKQNWSKKTIISGTKDKSVKKSFGGVMLHNDSLYYLDFENSLLISSSLAWVKGFPEITNSKTLKLPVPYPEYMQIWKGDIFVKAARENTMLRIRNNKVIQRYTFSSDEAVSPIVTFVLDKIDENKSIFYGTSWGPNGKLYRGILHW